MKKPGRREKKWRRRHQEPSLSRLEPDNLFAELRKYKDDLVFKRPTC